MPESTETSNASGNSTSTNNNEAVDKSKIKIGEKEYKIKDIESATSIYEALQDETTGKEIIETLARRAGLLDKEGDIKKKPGESDKQAESRAAKFLKKRLGKDYEKFSDSIGPALDELIEEAMAERFGEAEATSAKDKWDADVDKFNDTHEMNTDIEELMKDLLDESPPNFKKKTFNAQRYLGRLYKSAIEELGIEAPAEPKNKGRSREGRGEVDLPDFVVRDAPKNATLDDAVEAAVKGIRFKRRA